MRRTIMTVGAAALLLGSLAIAFATSVVGQDLEHQGELTSAGEAYAIDWQESEAGKVRLALVAASDARAPSALVSLFSPDREHLGAFELTAAWPSLDYLVSERGEHMLVVHQAHEATLDVFTEEHVAVSMRPAALPTERIDVLEGVHTDAAYQLALQREVRDVHMAVVLEGTAEDLVVEVLNIEDVPVLTTHEVDLVAADGVILPAELKPRELLAGSLVVRVTATNFNGSLALELVQFPEVVQQIFLPTPERAPQPGPSDEADDNATAEEAPDGNTTTDVPVRAQGVTIATLESGVPVAFTVPAGAHGVVLVAREDRAIAALYDPSDALVAELDASEDTPQAFMWDEDERQVAVPVPVTSAGEHVLVAYSSYEAELVVLGVEAADPARALDVHEVEVDLETSDEESGTGLLFVTEHRTANGSTTLDGGLLGVRIASELFELARDVTVTGPDGAVAYDGGATLSGVHDSICPDGLSMAFGAAGLYLVEVDAESLLVHEDPSIILLTYLR